MNKKGMRKHRIGIAYVKEFLDQHGHSRIPPRTVVDGLDVSAWWSSVRTHLREMPEIKRADILALGALGADLRTEKQIKAERLAAEAQCRALKALKHAEHEAQQFEQARQKALRPHQAVLDAVEAFAADRLHTLVPLGATTPTGIAYGRVLDRWRENPQGLGSHLKQALEDIPYWTWTRTPPPVRPAPRPRPAPIPADITRMNRTGLRQFLPAD
ncbi:cell envelope integrity protein TolA [Streptomyces sp. MH60]|uniref:cell envelope integrity protein TolA n=1 Tax=Streptomyces sp. MH60 TaxID=1940758 RepID=UPI000D45A7D6|nr:cell envelope integrity protein TolA [Streptomyces sp. MH60]PPS89553.1 hypothetical protein BZZ08_01700 [Streptomyces sp. MH60]